MLDVHPPHQAVRTWKDFLTHMATIVLGLLIAIGLEQSVEGMHHREQRHQLLEQLDAEHKQTLKDAKDTLHATAVQLDWYAKQIMALQAVAWQNQRYAKPAQPDIPPYSAPDDPVWRAAKSSGLTSLLAQRTVILNSEPELLLSRINELLHDVFLARGAMRNACGRLPVQSAATEATNYIHRDRKDVQECLGGTSAYYEALRNWYMYDAFVIGAEEAIETGETDADSMTVVEQREFDAASAQLVPMPQPK
jgi:hypothetical protein